MNDPLNDPCLNFIEVGTGKALRRIAVRRRAGAGPALLWLGGFKSDMQGAKAQALDHWAREQGRGWARPSPYSAEPYLITCGLIEDGRRHLLLEGMIETGCPVRILQGVQDPDVPWQHAVELTARFAQDDVVLTLVKDGDHRLSRPEDIERLLAAVAEF